MFYSISKSRINSSQLFIPCILLSSISYAQQPNNEEPQKLDSITLTAQGNWLNQANAEKVFNHAGARTILDRKDFEMNGSTSLKEALRQFPGVQVKDNAGTAGSDASLSIGVRGLASRFSPRTQILVDGVPLSFAPYGQPQLSLAPTGLGNIESIDVIRGAGSVRFGPQNVGGIINFNTRPIPESFASSLELTTEINKNGNLKLNPNIFIGDKTDNGLGFALLYSGVYGNGSLDKNDHTNISDIILKTSYDINDAHKLSAHLHYYEAKADLPGGLTEAEYRKNPFQSTRDYDYMKGHRTDGSLKYSYQEDNNSFEILSYFSQTFRDAGITNIPNNRYQIAPRDYQVMAIEPRFSHAYLIGSYQSEVSVGYRYLYEKSEEYVGRATNFSNNSTPVINRGWTSAHGNIHAQAAYIDNRFDIGKWSITPGIRFESIETKAHFYALNPDNSRKNSVNDRLKSNEWLPNLSVLYKLNPEWNLFANYAVSFAPLQYSQIAKIDAGNAILTTAGLKPEKAKTYELGARYLNGELSAEFTAFYIDFNEELKQICGSCGWDTQGATKHKGIEFGFNVPLDYVSETLANAFIYGNMTYVNATQATGVNKGKQLNDYSKLSGNLGLRYKYNNWTANLDTYAQSRQNKSEAFQSDGKKGPIPGFAIVGLSGFYDFSEYLNGLKVGLGVKNILDRQYYVRSTDDAGGIIVGPSRTFFVQTSFNF